MNKLQKNNQSGFSLVEGVLVLVIIALLGAAGFLVYKNHNKKSTTTPASLASTATKPNQTTQPATSITNAPQPGWKIYTNNTVGFSITYPDTIQADSGCATPSTVSNGAVPTTLISDAPNYYIAAENSIRFNLIWGANQTSNTNSCTQVPTDITSIQAANSSLKTGDQYEYAVENLHFFVEKVSSESDVQTALQSYWNDSTITINGWQNSSAGSYEVPTQINCAASEMVMGNTCGPLSSNYDLRYYPKEKLMFYFVLGQSVRLSSPNNSPSPDSQVISSFKVLN